MEPQPPDLPPPEVVEEALTAHPRQRRSLFTWLADTIWRRQHRHWYVICDAQPHEPGGPFPTLAPPMTVVLLMCFCYEPDQVVTRTIRGRYTLPQLLAARARAISEDALPVLASEREVSHLTGRDAARAKAED